MKKVLIIFIITIALVVSTGGVILWKQTAKNSSPKILGEDRGIGWFDGPNTYINEEFGYSIEYPGDWTFEKFSDLRTGGSFSPSNSSGYKPITIDVISCNDDCDKPFEDWVKTWAISGIQNFKKLNSIEAIVTNDRVLGYETDWLVSAWAGKPESISNLITFFENKQSVLGNNGDIKYKAVVVSGPTKDQENYEEYSKIYNEMLSSFRLIIPISKLEMYNIFGAVKDPCECLVNYKQGQNINCDNFFMLSQERWIRNFGDTGDIEILNLMEYLKGSNCQIAIENSDKYTLFFTFDQYNKPAVHLTVNSNRWIQDFNLLEKDTTMDIQSWWFYGVNLIDTNNDINLDGYRDLGILTGTGYGGVNFFYDYYLFNPQSGRFQFLVNICNPNFTDFNGNNMIVRSSCKSGPEYVETIYRFSGQGYTEETLIK